jgi:hypothetical protein
LRRNSGTCTSASIAGATGRCRRGGYTSRRRTDGSGRWGIAALEDKIVQRAVVEVLKAIYEEDFLGFSVLQRHGKEFSMNV